ncbi:hypothetical protein SHIRM173S_09391 [Streptomyces hirsutus]
MALWQRDRDEHPHVRGELIHHSDAGSQYTSFRLAEHLEENAECRSESSARSSTGAALKPLSRKVCPSSMLHARSHIRHWSV